MSTINTEASTNTISIKHDEDGIATLTLASSHGVNQLNQALLDPLQAHLKDLITSPDTQGIILKSAHKDFCVGADLNLLYQMSNAKQLRSFIDQVNHLLRQMECAGKPIVACLQGHTLGGGYEIALACHHRIAVNAKGKIGLPEAMLGLMPGAGGTQRLPRLIGIQPALELMTQGKTLSVSRALKAGLIDAIATDETEMITQAKSYIKTHPKAQQAWDKKGFRYPAHVQPNTTQARQLFLGASAMLYRKTAGAHQAPMCILEVVQEAAHLSIDAGIALESAAFVNIASDDTAKARLRSLWFHKRALEKGEDRVQSEEGSGIKKVAILGAGMMGAELAYLCAQAGKEVWIKDIKSDALERGMQALQGIVGKQKKLNADQKEQLLTRVHGTLALDDLQGSDLIIEAVFEDLSLKHRVIKECEGILAPNGVFASNTSALPITDLAQASDHPDRFIGLHFFSPASIMPLVEIIETETLNEQTLQRSWSFCREIGKTPVIVGDGYGFFTTRVFAAYILEGAECVAQGYSPALIEWAAKSAGMAVSPLKVFDEVTITLGMHAMQMRTLYNLPRTHEAGLGLLQALHAEGRVGRTAGKGFYDYHKTSKNLWKGLDHYHNPQCSKDLESMQFRILLVQALEAVRCLEDEVLRCPEDGDVASILGLGFAPNTGGPFAWLDQQGLSKVLTYADDLFQQGFAQFEPPALLQKMEQTQQKFYS
jgi:3-hydroxyacyl-CoA dehydrogenase / enoyl-CoA hydratase / 3-hydroxybutyryl-CoA epimerase